MMSSSHCVQNSIWMQSKKQTDQIYSADLEIETKSFDFYNLRNYGTLLLSTEMEPFVCT